MKKYLIASIVALTVALVGVSVSASFDSNLSVGSTGASVTALQQTLIARGFSIPAGATGYFGQQTKAAVVAYQASKSLPTTGFVGPLTRGALNGSPAVVTAMTLPFPCPAGYTAPAGWVCPGTTTPAIYPSTGTDGSISVSDSSFVSSGQSIKKGETKNVVAVKLQATAGPVTVTRVDAHFSVRPWLYFSQAQLIDSTGKILASKSIMSPADATEITVGSDYLVRFEGLNYTVTPGVNPDLVVGVSVLPATDKITNGQTVYVGIPTGAIRTVNGIGITDSVGGAAAFSTNTSGAGARLFTLSSTGSVADITTRISPNAPATQSTKTVSATVPTNGIELGVFSLKSANNSSTVNAMNFTIQTNPAFTQTGLFSNLRIVVGSQSYGAIAFGTNAAGSTVNGLVRFTNLNIQLPQDQWTDVKLVADVAATSTDVYASSTLVATSIDAIDSTYTAATVGGQAMASAPAGSSQTSANTFLTVNSVTLSNASAGIVQEIKGLANSSVTTAATVRYTFTLTNNSSNSMYVSSDVSKLINATTTVPAANASSTITTIEPIAAVAGDASGYYILPSGGGSRTFTVSGIIQKSSGTLKSERMSVTSVQYGATTAGTGTSITSGLETLTVAVTI
jgi:peptidoglycan hydrolase-like protein with peptidoglycan-binding domain